MVRGTAFVVGFERLGALIGTLIGARGLGPYWLSPSHGLPLASAGSRVPCGDGLGEGGSARSPLQLSLPDAPAPPRPAPLAQSLMKIQTLTP